MSPAAAAWLHEQYPSHGENYINPNHVDLYPGLDGLIRADRELAALKLVLGTQAPPVAPLDGAPPAWFPPAALTQPPRPDPAPRPPSPDQYPSGDEAYDVAEPDAEGAEQLAATDGASGSSDAPIVVDDEPASPSAAAPVDPADEDYDEKLARWAWARDEGILSEAEYALLAERAPA